MRPAFVDPHAGTEIRRYARMTPEARLELFLQLCDLTDGLQRDRPDCRALRAPTPRSPEAISVWERLMARR